MAGKKSWASGLTISRTIDGDRPRRRGARQPGCGHAGDRDRPGRAGQNHARARDHRRLLPPVRPGLGRQPGHRLPLLADARLEDQDRGLQRHGLRAGPGHRPEAEECLRCRGLRGRLETAVVLLWSQKLPTAKDMEYIAKQCSTDAECVVALVARHNSIAGSIINSARAIEWAMARLFQFGYDVSRGRLRRLARFPWRR